MNRITRRTMVAGLALAPIVATSPVFALSESQAEGLVRSLVAEITSIINSGGSESQMLSSFQSLFGKYADVPTIAQYSLGADGRSASAAQMRAYQDAFAGYITRKYGRRFREFIGGTIEVKGSRTDKSFVVVNSTAILKGKQPFAVDFLVSDRSGSGRFFNVIIEGVNMLTSERTEIGAMLDQQGGSIDKLTAQLKSLG
jgi:phospholipid transport system substrate-binding protein